MLKKIYIALIFLFFGLIFYYHLLKPSNYRDWSIDQAVLPEIIFAENLIGIKHIRNFAYKSEKEFIPAYYDKTYDLDKLKSVDYIVEPFGNWHGPAHTFLTFGFNDNNYLAISIEIRKEKGEYFSALKGLFKNYEIMYVFGDEKDLIKLRTNYRKDRVYLYHLNLSQNQQKKLLIDMLNRAEKLRKKPEFYNTLTNTCMTNVIKHLNKVTDKKLPTLNFKVLFPAFSDELFLQAGLISSNMGIIKLRQKSLINTKAEKLNDDADFSLKIR